MEWEISRGKEIVEELRCKWAGSLYMEIYSAQPDRGWVV